MKNKLLRTVLPGAMVLSIIILVLGTGCATTSPADSEDALGIISLINSGNAEELTRLSADSFLLDTEVLHSSTLTGSLWKGLTDSGFALENAVIIETKLPGAGDKALFGNSLEIDGFFNKYIPPQSVLFRIASDKAEIVLILGPEADGTNSIIAFGGPF